MVRLRWAIVLAMAVALGPFALDTYLPAFPSIADSMQVKIHDIGLSVSFYIFGLAFGQLVGGPLSDQWGRAKIMLAGLTVFLIASIFLIFSHTLTELLIWRAIQALGGGWSAVSVPAIVRDRTEGKEAANLFSLISSMMIIAPALAPSIGSLILTVANWRGIFLFLAIYSLLVIFLLKIYVFSIPPIARDLSKPKMNLLAGYTAVLKHKTAIYFILLQAFVFSTLLIFLTNASFIYQKWFALSKFTFALLFACNVAMLGFLSITNRVLLRYLEPVHILCFAVILQVLAVLALITMVFIHPPRIELFVPAMMFVVGSIGAIAPNNQAYYLEFFKDNSGTAAALMGALQLTIGGCMSALSTFIANGTLRPIVLLMGVCAFFCLFLVWRVWLLHIRAK